MSCVPPFGTDHRAVETPVFIPECVRAERWLSVGLLLTSIAYLAIFCRYSTIEPDEGIILEGAQRILHGQVLYRDFFSFFTPGSYYWTALLFKIFGNSFIVARLALAVLGGVLSVICYLLSRRVCSRRVALLIAALVTLTALPYRFLVLHNWDSTLLASLTIYCAVRLMESQHWGWALGLGSCASLTVLFEQSKGAGLLLGLSLAFVLIYCSSNDRQAFRGKNLVWIAGGLAWPVIVVGAYFAAHHAFESMLSDWFWPLRHYTLANRVPYGFQNWSEAERHAIFSTGPLAFRVIKVLVVSPTFFVPILPLIGVGLLGYWSVQILRRRLAGCRASYYVLLTSSFLGLLISVLVVRADIIHFMYVLPLCGPTIAWIVDGRDIPGRCFKAVRPVLAAYLVVALGAFSLPLLIRARSSSHEIQTRRGVIRTPASDTVIDYVQLHVPRGEPLLVYPYLPLYNYLTDTASPTRYDYFQPGMHTLEQANEMVEQLSARRVPWVLFESSFPEKIPNAWPKTPQSAIQQDPVRDYITSSYRNCRVLTSPSDWKFLFMVRKDLPCPR
jgi:4-amino-4-deoxy-L-arabinose transferase-like glycosyltransferase